MLTDLHSLAESAVASYLIVGSLAFLVNSHIPRAFFNTVTNIEENEVLIYLIAWMFLIFGFLTVWIHNDWNMSYSILVTLFGWIIIIRGALWLLFPKHVIRLVKKMSFIKGHPFRIIYSSVFLLIGLFILLKTRQ
ncbi:MAG: hypothetical protein OXN83_01455 [Oligoflexia bacterium]|nr:hypothetical protein [Oligoflexia bacterium]